jgi:hypothetical protein
MKNKEERSYYEVFNYLIEKFNIDLKTVLVDFEIAIVNSIRKVFPYSVVYGFNFHFGQTICRKIKNVGLSEEYKNNGKVRKIFRMLLNLSYFPSKLKEKAYETLLKSINNLQYERKFEDLKIFRKNVYWKLFKIPNV